MGPGGAVFFLMLAVLPWWVILWRRHCFLPPSAYSTEARQLLVVLIGFLLLWSSAQSSATDILEIPDLIAKAAQYDRRMVTVIGRVENLQVASTHQGQIGYGFLLKDHNKTVRVLGLGRAAVQNGEQVIVEGIFYRLRQVGRASAYNEIKANHIRSLARLNPDFVG